MFFAAIADKTSGGEDRLLGETFDRCFSQMKERY